MRNTIVTVTCPTCGHKWQEDLEQANDKRTIFKGDNKATYAFNCPRDGTQVIFERRRKE